MLNTPMRTTTNSINLVDFTQVLQNYADRTTKAQADRQLHTRTRFLPQSWRPRLAAPMDPITASAYLTRVARQYRRQKLNRNYEELFALTDVAAALFSWLVGVNCYTSSDVQNYLAVTPMRSAIKNFGKTRHFGSATLPFETPNE